MNSSSLKPALLWLLVLWQTAPPPTPPASHFRYQRSVMLAPASISAAAQACAILDADVFAHAAASLRDLRLYSGQFEIPYATTLSESLQQESEDARIFNLRSQSGHILFDIEMPHRPYTGLILDLAAHDYIAVAAVSGSATPGNKKATQLGTFTLFDLTSQHLSQSTDIPLAESTFPYLHLDLALTHAPGGLPIGSSAAGSSAAGLSAAGLSAIVKAATVPPSREAQSLYTITQAARPLHNGAGESGAMFNVQTRVPVERVTFILPSGYKGNFSRAVKIVARGISDLLNTSDQSSRNAAILDSEGITGSILRVHKAEAGHDLSAEHLSIPVAIGSNMQQPAVIAITVENGSEQPLPISVELQMRQRKICFDTRSAETLLTLYYGDPSLGASTYTDAALDQAVANPRTAQLGSETENFAVTTTLPPRKNVQYHPVLRWIALLGCVGIFALLIIRSAHRKRR